MRSRLRRFLLPTFLALVVSGAAALTGLAANPDNTKVAGIDVDQTTIPELQELMNRHRISSVNLTNFYLQRIRKLNPELNAVIHTRFDEARAAASGTLPDGPFTGVPTLFKDLGCAVEGEPYHEGMKFLKDAAYRSPHTDNLAKKYFAAGFVPDHLDPPPLAL